MDGYLAEARPEYELLIRDKIKNEIESSDYLVGIITDNALHSASVHEEIGYAIGKDIPVLLMVEKGLKEKGVLIYGKELEYFTEKFFNTHCEAMIKFLKKKGKRLVQSAEAINTSFFEFLAERNLVDPKLSNFAKNEHFEMIRCDITEDFIPNGKPYILFSCCPKTIKERVDVNSRDFSEWIDRYRDIKIKEHNIRFLEGSKVIDMDSVMYQHKPRNDEVLFTYLEFHNNGFFEQCLTNDSIHHSDEYYQDHRRKNSTPVLLHLCSLIGSFWTFLKFCKLYYEQVNINEPFDVQMSIRNTKDLMLMGFGGESSENRKYTDPVDGCWFNPDPRTTKKNIKLKLEKLTVDKMSDDFIEEEVKRIAKKISNAYGLEEARCFSYDGSFAWDLMRHFRR